MALVGPCPWTGPDGFPRGGSYVRPTARPGGPGAHAGCGSRDSQARRAGAPSLGFRPPVRDDPLGGSSRRRPQGGRPVSRRRTSGVPGDQPRCGPESPSPREPRLRWARLTPTPPAFPLTSLLRWSPSAAGRPSASPGLPISERWNVSPAAAQGAARRVSPWCCPVRTRLCLGRGSRRRDVGPFPVPPPGARGPDASRPPVSPAGRTQGLPAGRLRVKPLSPLWATDTLGGRAQAVQTAFLPNVEPPLWRPWVGPVYDRRHRDACQAATFCPLFPSPRVRGGAARGPAVRPDPRSGADRAPRPRVVISGE